MNFLYKLNDVEIDTDINRLDKATMYSYLKTTYWANARTKEQFETAIQNSINFGLYKNDVLIGYARVITDMSVFFYLGDVFILPEFQGKGYAKLLITTIHDIPEFKNIRRFILFTRDAHSLYEKVGYTIIENPARCMEIVKS
jgi:GNAT superfamily N-acetyltransferase